MTKTIYINMRRDSTVDIIEDCTNPTIIQVSRLNGEVFAKLTETEKQVLATLKGLDRELKLREITLNFVQQYPGKVNKILNPNN